MSNNRVPRVAICGVMLESNSFAPVSTEADFRERGYFTGDEIMVQARTENSAIAREIPAFVGGMDSTGPWEEVPLIFTACQPGGPIDHDFFERCISGMEKMLAEAGPVDAVFVANHGAMTSTETPDPDGEMIERLRKAVGPKAPIIVTHDLHANVSERLLENTTLLIGYQTNPHVDMQQRAEEAAFSLRLILAGKADPKTAFIRLPITPPSVTLLTATGPYADMITYGQRRMQELGGAILNVTILGGFVYSDTPKNGVAIVVTARDDIAPAQKLAREIADLGWQERPRFRKELTPIETAVEAALARNADPKLPAEIYSDAGDNPGGGGRGNTTWLLKALVEAGAKDVLYGSFVDPALAEECHRLGKGATFLAKFNSKSESEFSKPFEAEAEVIGLTDGKFIGKFGIFEGRLMDCGPSAALRIGGIVVVVMTYRQQTADAMFFEQFGLDIAAARTVCVKSRGHFRAAFSVWFKPEQVVEVDTAGLTSPVLERFDFKGLPRPAYPLDEDAHWSPPNWW
jgi:microcystin degradation protein MlrC